MDTLTETIIERARLNRYIPHPPSGVRDFTEPKIIKVKEVGVRRKFVGPYEIEMQSRGKHCTLRLYHWKENWNRKLQATQTGEDMFECDRLFERVVEAIIQVRMEEKRSFYT